MTDELLYRYITGQANDEENQIIHQWISKSEESGKEVARLKNSWILSGLEQEIDPLKKKEAMEKILYRVRTIKNNERIKSIRSRWIQYAAILILAIGLSGSVGYFLSQAQYKNSIGYTEVIVPKGERTDVVLPDGSTVKLNAGSSLKFEPAFQPRQRTVMLEGEAFFQVTHDPSKPFIVKTSSLEVEVLGTSFDVSSYPGDEHITTYLKTGKVKIQTKSGEEIYLNPTQAVTYSKQSGEIQKSNLKSDYLLDWTKGLLTVKDETIEEFSKKLERRYDIKIIFGDDDVKNHHYTGSINDEDLNTVLDALKFASSLEYEREGSVITLLSK